jgi:putative ABC transport system permease protein
MKRQLAKFAYRSLLKNRSFTLISLFGLATSLAASLVIFNHYMFELSFDKHIPDAERTYRIITRYGEGRFWAKTFACYGDALTDRPEVEKMTTFHHIPNNRVSVGESLYTLPETVLADSAFIDFFNLELLSGRAVDLDRPNTVYVTEEWAERLFPGTNPLGEEIILQPSVDNRADSSIHLSIAGVVKSMPEHTHFGFDMICSQ